MFLYQLRMAFLSLKRNPFLSALLIGGIALGIAVSVSFLNINRLLSQDPIPEKSDRLFAVQIDAWSPNSSFSRNHPEEPPDQLTYRDAMGLMENDIPTYQSVMFKSLMTVHPERSDVRPFRVWTRLCFSDFFPMFEVPFRWGSGWSRLADAGPDRVVVLSYETNVRLFGDVDSVGRSVRVEEQDYRVAGVMQPWEPSPKFYDVLNGAFQGTEAMYMPFAFTEPLEISTGGNTSGWGFTTGTSFRELMLESEYTWIQMWVQLDDEDQRDRYLAYLSAYVEEQKALGRMERPLNNRLRTVPEWLDAREVVPPHATTMAILSVLFLVVCAFNLIGILLGKFLARAPEVGVRRALGASRRSVFAQHLVECQTIGVLGGVLGLLLSLVLLRGIDRLFGSEGSVLNFQMIAIGLGLSIGAAFVAGVYPAWRICRIPPATYLKLQ